MPEIHLVRVGQIRRDLIDFLLVALPDSLGMHCRVLDSVVEPAPAYHPARQQYNSMDILLNLTGLHTSPQAKVLGLTSVDLFIPILTFVFGQAQLNNRNALMSVHRLRQDFYGLPANEDLLYARAEKEALHELGHTFGLVHCPRFECVMYLSNSIDQVDLKSSAFCESCREFVDGAKLAHSNY
jgi:archaemetzincin